MRTLFSALLLVAGTLMPGCVEKYRPEKKSDDGEPAIQASTSAKTPPLILITVDTLRADRVGSYGHEAAKTPVMDALAADGIRFDQSTTAFPRTTPAMASLFTGLWPHHHGSREVWQKVSEGVFLTEILSRAGYHTVGVSSNTACGKSQGFDKGFAEFVQLEDANADVVTDKALALLAKRKKDRPLFLWVHYMDPHWPYDPPRQQMKGQPKAPACRALMQQINRTDLRLGQVHGNANGVAEKALADCSLLYDAAIAFADQETGRLVEGLEKEGIWDEAVVVFTSDHGENLGEDDFYFGHGPSVHDASLRVPLVLRGPGIPRGRVDRGVARSEDVLPTLLTTLGISEKQWPVMDGADLTWRWDDGATIPEHTVNLAFAESGTALWQGVTGFVASGRRGRDYCVHDERYTMCIKPKTNGRVFYDRHADPGLDTPIEGVPEDALARLEKGLQAWPSGRARQRTIRTPKAKLVERPQLAGGYEPALYDLEQDPEETRNRFGDHKKKAAELKVLLDRWLKDQPVYTEENVSSEAARALKALGYIGD